MHFPELKFLSSNFLLEQDVLVIDSLFQSLLTYKCDILWIRILHNKTDQLDQPDHTQYQCIPEHSHVSQIWERIGKVSRHQSDNMVKHSRNNFDFERKKEAETAL